jgi:NAD(P)-dependent dehydrogenase (short-subunit alcohol dehydrogenase family)
MTSETPDLAAATAFVTGGGGAIGAEVAACMAEEGRRVAVADRDLEAAERVSRRLSDAGAEALAVELDVGSEESWSGALEEAGPVGVLVNAAGIEGPVERLGDYPVEAFDEVLRVNARGTFLGMRSVLPAMARAGEGCVVNVSSSAGLVGTPKLGAYVASKHAVLGLTRAAAVEYGPKGVRVNAVCPGPTEGRMIESIERGRGGGEAARVRQAYLDAIPLRRYAEPGQVAAAVAFLASARAGSINGAALAVDGGMTAI